MMDLEQDAWLAYVRKMLPAAFHQLGRDEQYVVIMHFYEKRGIDELAQNLECHPERVRQVLETALRTLRRDLSG